MIGLINKNQQAESAPVLTLAVIESLGKALSEHDLVRDKSVLTEELLKWSLAIVQYWGCAGLDEVLSNDLPMGWGENPLKCSCQTREGALHQR